MRKNVYFLNILLAVLVTLLCLWGMLVRTFAPSVLLPHISIPMMVLVMVLALAAERYLGSAGRREWLGAILLGSLTMTVLPVLTDLTGTVPVWRLFLCSVIVFTATTALYTSMCKRMASGPTARFAPLINALLLFLAAQFFQGVML